MGLVAVPIWLRYEDQDASSDKAAVSGSLEPPHLTASQQGMSTPENISGRSDTPTVDWDVSTPDGNAVLAGDRPSSMNRDTSMLCGETRTKSTEIRPKLTSVDWIGSILMIASSTSFLVGLSLGGNKYPWRSSAVLVPIVAGLGGTVITVMYEQRYTGNPFLRLAIYQHWSGIVVSICTIMQGFIVSGLHTPPPQHD